MKTKHLNTNIVVSELNLTYFFIEMNDTYDYSDLLSLPISLPLIRKMCFTDVKLSYTLI
jgi:hypothetical protein